MCASEPIDSVCIAAAIQFLSPWSSNLLRWHVSSIGSLPGPQISPMWLYSGGRTPHGVGWGSAARTHHGVGWGSASLELEKLKHKHAAVEMVTVSARQLSLLALLNLLLDGALSL